MIAERQKSVTARAQAMARIILRAKTVRAYRRLFLKDGQLSPEAVLVLADLSRAAGMGKAVSGANGEELNFREGRRTMMLHLFARLDAQSLEKLAQRIREANADDHADD